MSYGKKYPSEFVKALLACDVKPTDGFVHPDTKATYYLYVNTPRTSLKNVFMEYEDYAHTEGVIVKDSFSAEIIQEIFWDKEDMKTEWLMVKDRYLQEEISSDYKAIAGKMIRDSLDLQLIERVPGDTEKIEMIEKDRDCWGVLITNYQYQDLVANVNWDHANNTFFNDSDYVGDVLDYKGRIWIRFYDEWGNITEAGQEAVDLEDSRLNHGLPCWDEDELNRRETDEIEDHIADELQHVVGITLDRDTETFREVMTALYESDNPPHIDGDGMTPYVDENELEKVCKELGLTHNDDKEDICLI